MTHGEGVNIQAQDQRIRVGSWNLRILTFSVFFSISKKKQGVLEMQHGDWFILGENARGTW